MSDTEEARLSPSRKQRGACGQAGSRQADRVDRVPGRRRRWLQRAPYVERRGAPQLC